VPDTPSATTGAAVMAVRRIARTRVVSAAAGSSRALRRAVGIEKRMDNRYQSGRPQPDNSRLILDFVAWSAQCYEAFRNRLANGKRGAYIGDMDALTHTEAQNAAVSRRNPLALYEPHNTRSVHSRRRFIRSRRAHYIAQVGGGQATPEQADIIAQLVTTAWQQRVVQAEVEAEADPRMRIDLRRQAAELGRQLILLRRDLDRAEPPPVPPKAPPTLAEHLAMLEAASGSAAA
jgi:hypothetical protein